MGSALVHKHVVRLTVEQRKRLLDCTRNGMTAAKKLMHARVLLLSDRAHLEGQRTDTYIAEVLGVHLTPSNAFVNGSSNKGKAQPCSANCGLLRHRKSMATWKPI